MPACERVSGNRLGVNEPQRNVRNLPHCGPLLSVDRSSADADDLKAIFESNKI